MKTFLESPISEHEVANCLHVLAAANHRHWMLWESLVIPKLKLDDSAAIDTLLVDLEAEPEDMKSVLRDLLVRNAKTVVDLVEQEIRVFAYQPPMQPLLDRKRQQLISWIEYACNGSREDIKRWKQQCRTPFLGLSPKQQRSDYDEAARDFLVVAKEGGLVIPDPLPQVEPLDGRAAKRRLWRHSWGMHGGYAVSESPWSRVCQACHAKQGYL